MIVGQVDDAGIPFALLEVAGQRWKATIDTGFNGDLELPLALGLDVNAEYFGRGFSLLAGNQVLDEEQYLVDFPFDGEVVRAVATFVDGNGILVGTNLLRNYELTVDFPARTVALTRSS